MIIRDPLTSDGPDAFSREALADAYADDRLEVYLGGLCLIARQRRAESLESRS